MRFNPKNMNCEAKAERYALYRYGDSIRSVCQIDQLGIEYSLYRNRPVYVFRERKYVDEFVFIRYVITSPRSWNRWVKHAEQLTYIGDCNEQD